jgi:hypothetical protein
MYEHRFASEGSFGNGWLYLYADGRLIWEQLDPDPTGGWLEQRLTPEGVELVLSEIIATGLFDPDQPAPPPPELARGEVQVRIGDQLVTREGVPDLRQRLAELWSWLPADAWVDQEAKAYVPSRHAVCDVVPSSRLPTAAQDVLATARRIDLAALGFEGWSETCFDIATEEARALVTILEAAGSKEHPQSRGSWSGSEVFYDQLSLWPMLPHGVPAFTGA